MINFRNYPQLTKVVIPSNVQLSTTNFTNTFVNMKNLVSTIVPDDKITNMTNMYSNCYKLTGNPVCGNNVTVMAYAYNNCQNITGSPVCGPNVTHMANTYNNCRNLTGSPVCGENVKYMSGAYTNCHKLTGSPVCGDNVITMSETYKYCYNLTGSPVCGPNVNNMYGTYLYCNNITGAPVCGNNVDNMSHAYVSCKKLTGSPVCGKNVTNMYRTYVGCHNISGSPVCGEKVTTLSEAYQNCYNLTGSPVCGNNVKFLSNTYQNCNNITGSPVCGPNVINMVFAYDNALNLTGSPACGDKVTNMTYAYYNCRNLTGSPVCGENVTTMGHAYSNCRNLTGSPVCGSNVTNMCYTYQNCSNLSGNSYFYSNNISAVRNCFYGRNTSNRLNIYVHKNTTSLTTLLTNNYASLVGTTITWTNDTAANGYYYNATKNIYIYPVANVAAAKEANETPQPEEPVVPETPIEIDNWVPFAADGVSLMGEEVYASGENTVPQEFDITRSDCGTYRVFINGTLVESTFEVSTSSYNQFEIITVENATDVNGHTRTLYININGNSALCSVDSMSSQYFNLKVESYISTKTYVPLCDDNTTWTGETVTIARRDRNQNYPRYENGSFVLSDCNTYKLTTSDGEYAGHVTSDNESVIIFENCTYGIYLDDLEIFRTDNGTYEGPITVQALKDPTSNGGETDGWIPMAADGVSCMGEEIYIGGENEVPYMIELLESDTNQYRVTIDGTAYTGSIQKGTNWRRFVIDGYTGTLRIDWQGERSNPARMGYNSSIGKTCTLKLERWVTPTESTITFTIDGTECQADNGMTWLEWCRSDYNTDRYLCESDTSHVNDADASYEIINVGTNTFVTGGEEIIANANYDLAHYLEDPEMDL